MAGFCSARRAARSAGMDGARNSDADAGSRCHATHHERKLSGSATDRALATHRRGGVGRRAADDAGIRRTAGDDRCGAGPAALVGSCHLPLFFYPGWTTAPFATYLRILLGASLILTSVTNLARFNVLAPIAAHASFNTISGWLAGLFAETRPAVGIRFEAVLAACGLVVGAVLIGMTRGRLFYEGRRDGRPLLIPDP